MCQKSGSRFCKRKATHAQYAQHISTNTHPFLIPTCSTVTLTAQGHLFQHSHTHQPSRYHVWRADTLRMTRLRYTLVVTVVSSSELDSIVLRAPCWSHPSIASSSLTPLLYRRHKIWPPQYFTLFILIVRACPLKDWVRVSVCKVSLVNSC